MLRIWSKEAVYGILEQVCDRIPVRNLPSKARFRVFFHLNYGFDPIIHSEWLKFSAFCDHNSYTYPLC